MSEIASVTEPEISTVTKSGTIVTQVTISRSPKGVSLTVTAQPAVEEFARALGDGDSQDVRVYGRYWHQIGNMPLRIYNHDSKLVKLEMLSVEDQGSKIAFRYDQPGHPLYDGNGCLNLSFLRLVGISEGAGVTFGVSGVYTLENLRRIRDHISVAGRKFYVHYMRPVDLSVTISTQDLLF